MKINIVILALNAQLMCRTPVDMPIVALFYPVAVEDVKYVIIEIISEYRRIVHEDYRLKPGVHSRSHRHFKPLDLPFQHLFVLNVFGIRAVHPAARTAYTVFAVFIMIIVEYPQSGKSF